LELAVKHYRAPVYCIMQCLLPDHSDRKISRSARHIDDQHTQAAMPQQQQGAPDHQPTKTSPAAESTAPLSPSSTTPTPKPLHCAVPLLRPRTLPMFNMFSPTVRASKPTAMPHARTWTQKHKSGLAPTTAFDTKAPSNVHLVAPARHSCNAINVPWLIESIGRT
jgi:hypothetical protein